MRRLLPLVALATIFVADEGLACSCGTWPTPAAARQNATAVFEGVVVGKSPVLASYMNTWFVAERWTFAVDHAWKGAGATVIVTEGYSNCTLIYTLGERALVYAYRHEVRSDELEAHKCGTPRQSVDEQRRELGKPLHSFRPGQRRVETKSARAVRHGRVYALAAVAGALNVFTADAEHRVLVSGYLVIGSAVVLLLSVVTAVIVRRRRASILAAGVIIFLALVCWAGRREVTNGSFGHLVEYRCDYCPGG